MPGSSMQVPWPLQFGHATQTGAGVDQVAAAVQTGRDELLAKEPLLHDVAHSDPSAAPLLHERLPDEGALNVGQWLDNRLQVGALSDQMPVETVAGLH